MVNWELRRPKGRDSQWLEAARTAKTILDVSDPGYRYWNKENVQSSNARTSNANRVAFISILADILLPLRVERDDRKLYSWLLAGTKRNAHKIQGGTGLCPKLLHLLAMITQLTARAAEVSPMF